MTEALTDEEAEKILENIDWENYDFSTDYENLNLTERTDPEVYTKEFIEELCTFEALTLEEHNLCFNYNQTVQDFSYSHILIGAFMGFIAVKGLFDSWK